MADERPITTPSGKEVALTNEQIRAAKKAKFAQVLDRGYVNDRLNAVKLSAGEHGQWVRKDDMEITRMQMLGYQIADPKKYASGEPMPHGDGTFLQLGDVVFMVCSAEDHELHKEIRAEKFKQTYIKQPREGIKLQREFKDLEKHGIQLVDESSAQVLTSPKDL